MWRNEARSISLEGNSTPSGILRARRILLISSRGHAVEDKKYNVPKLPTFGILISFPDILLRAKICEFEKKTLAVVDHATWAVHSFSLRSRRAWSIADGETITTRRINDVRHCHSKLFQRNRILAISPSFLSLSLRSSRGNLRNSWRRLRN